MLCRKRKLLRTVCAALPAALLLACGTVQEDTGIVTLLEEQEKVFAGAADGESPGFLAESGRTVFVHICGEVAYPGVYEVPAESRLCDVLLLAGGFTDEAATDSVNLAKQAADGMQIVIPSVRKEEQAAARREQERSGLVNLNTATKEELCALSGIGAGRAAAIIAYRDAHGGFSAVEEIMQVDGIKSGIYEKLKDKIYVEIE